LEIKSNPYNFYNLLSYPGFDFLEQFRK